MKEIYVSLAVASAIIAVIISTMFFIPRYRVW